jgi:PAS domain S-box-containing protein
MQWRSRPFWLGLALIALPALIVVAVEVYQVVVNVPQLRRNQQLTAHSIEVITTARRLERAIQDAERGQRGFLITGDAAYLEPYETGIKEVSASFAGLKALTVDNSEQQLRWPILERQINIKLDELKRTIDARRNVGFDAARQIVETNVGVEAMRAINQILDAAEATESIRLQSRQALGDETETGTRTVSLIGGGIALVIIVTGVIILSRNFGRIVKSEQARRESEERLRLMISGIVDYAIFMLDLEGRVVFWNRGAERMKGYTAEEIIGRHFSCFYTSEDTEAEVPSRLLQEAARDGRASREGWRIRKDGSRFWANVLLTAIRDDEGVLRGFAKLTRDMTEQKKADSTIAQEREAREQAEDILRQAQKMDVLGQLTGGIAHDFNNMLGVIVGSLEVLQRRLQTDDPKIMDPIRSAWQAADRSAALTHGLLAFSRQQPLEPKSIDLNKLVAGMSGLLNRTLGENIEIETVLAAGLWTIAADINQLENALMNLAVNARDAMPKGGKLTIETGNTYLDEAYAWAHTEVTPGQYVMIAVTDTGTGMSEATIERAFEPFFTTKEPGQGTGLGLSQIFGFIKQSAGHVKIYSEPGEGTTVKLYLPRAPGGEIHAREQAAAPPPATQPRSETILIVEDNDLLLESVSTMLQEQGYCVLAARTGVAALQLLDAEKEVDLLFTDVGLPGGINGQQLANEARRRHPDLIVLFTTGYTQNAIIHQGRLDPGVEFIGKPFTYAALVDRIQRLLDAEPAKQSTSEDTSRTQRIRSAKAS